MRPRPTSIASGWTTAVGLWVVFSIMSLHGIGISLSHQNLRRTGWQGLSKQWLPVTLLGGAMVVVVTSLAMHWSTLASAGSIRASLTEAHRLLTSGAVGIVLWPFRAMLQVPLAPTVAAFWIALPWSLLILAVNYVWVLRADVAAQAHLRRVHRAADGELDGLGAGRAVADDEIGRASGRERVFDIV